MSFSETISPFLGRLAFVWFYGAAAIVLLQILLGDRRYRRFADFAIARLGVGLREKAAPLPQQLEPQGALA